MTFGIFAKDENGKPREAPFARWCSNTTCHGIIDWYTSKHWTSFILWLILIILCFFACLFQVISLMLDFKAYPFYRTNVYMNDSNQAPWPNVTICNLNRIMNETAMYPPYKLDNKAIIWLLGSPRLDYDFNVYAKEVPEYEAAWKKYLNNSKEDLRTPDALFRTLGHDCWFMFKKCQFGSLNFECCNHAQAIMNREYGLCWSITPPSKHPGQPATQEIPGSAHGLKLFVRPLLQLYLDKTIMLNNYLEKGVVVSIDYNPYRMIFADPLIVTPGKQARIGLKSTSNTYTIPAHMRMFPLECKEGGQLEILKGPYERENCYYECMQQQSLRECGCILLSEHKTNDLVCDMSRLYKCYNVTDFSKLERDDAQFDACADACIPKCEEDFQVQATSTISDYPEPKFIQPIADRYAAILLGSDPSKMSDAMKKNLEALAASRAKEIEDEIYLNIYFPGRGYQVINRREKISIFELMANIGGQTGLWLGASILTLCQAIYYLGYGLFRNLYYDKTRDKKDEKATSADNQSFETSPPTEYEDRKFSNISSVLSDTSDYSSPRRQNFSRATNVSRPPSKNVLYKQRAWGSSSDVNKKRPRMIDDLRKRLNKNKRKDTVTPPPPY